MISTYDSVAAWNATCGKAPPPIGTQKYYEALANQIKRIQEELDEFVEGVNNRDIGNMLKEGADLDVVVSGLNYLLGADYTSIISSVLSNNNLKTTTDYATAYDAMEFYSDKGTKCFIYSYEDPTGEITVYSVKREGDDKVMKLLGHPSIDLSALVPKAVPEVILIVKDLEEKFGKKFDTTLSLSQNICDYDGIKVDIDGLGVEVSFSADRLKSNLSEYILKAI